MHTTKNLLEECSQASKQYTKLMSQYKDFFNCLFSNPLQAFGYERWTTDDVYYGFSNMPAIAELFVDTNAFADQNVIVRPKNMSSFCTFIYPDEKNYNLNYNDFRNSLEKHLQIRVSFCIVKRRMHYCEAFVWNFKKPNMSLPDEKRTIVNDFIRNSTLINACINQFKKDITFLLPLTFSGINIRQHSPLYMDGSNPMNNVGDYSLYVALSHYVKLLQREQLTFNDFGLSQKAQETVEFFLSTGDAKSDDSEILKTIALKFESVKHHANMEAEHHELQRIGLIRPKKTKTSLRQK